MNVYMDMRSYTRTRTGANSYIKVYTNIDAFMIRFVNAYLFKRKHTSTYLSMYMQKRSAFFVYGNI